MEKELDEIITDKNEEISSLRGAGQLASAVI
jgi:hypothetical protein